MPRQVVNAMNLENWKTCKCRLPDNGHTPNSHVNKIYKILALDHQWICHGRVEFGIRKYFPLDQREHHAVERS